MDTDLTKLRVEQARPPEARAIALPPVSVFRTPGRDHGAGCLGCELKGLLRSVAGWATLYDVSKGNLSDEEIDRLVQALRRDVWGARRLLNTASFTGSTKAISADASTGRMGWNYRTEASGAFPISTTPNARSAKWLVETVNPIIFVGSSLTADSKPALFVHLRDLANRAIDRLASTECTLLPEVPAHVSA